MSLLISCQSVSKSFGSRILFEELSLSIFSGDRIGLIGPNGAGKSTFMKILAGKEKIDTGSYTAKKDLKVGYVAQKNEFERKLPEEISGVMSKFLKLIPLAYSPPAVISNTEPHPLPVHSTQLKSAPASTVHNIILSVFG